MGQGFGFGLTGEERHPAKEYGDHIRSETSEEDGQRKCPRKKK